MKHCDKFIIVLLICTVAAFCAVLPAKAQIGDKKKGDPRIARALTELKLKYEINDDSSFRLNPISLANGRKQTVVIESKTETYRGLEIREILGAAYIKRGLLSEKVANYLLRQTYENKLGFWCIRYLSVDGTPADEGLTIVMYVVRVAADSDTDTLKSSILNVASAADDMEKLLTDGKDLI